MFNRAQLDHYLDIVMRRRWLVVAVAGLVMLTVSAGAVFIGISNDYRIMFNEDDPQLATLDQLERTYSESRAVLIALAPNDGSIFTREGLGALEEMTETAWRAPYSSRVNSLTNYSHSEALGDDLIVEPLVEDAGSLSDADLARVETTALNEIEIAGRLVSLDGRVGGLAINFVLPDNEDAAVVEITDYLNGALDEARAQHTDIAYYMTGDVVMSRTFADATRDDLEILGPVVFLVIVAAAALLLRSLYGTIALAVLLMFIVNTTMGVAGWLGTMFSPSNAGVPIIVMTVAIAHSVHIVTATLHRMSHGMEKNAAIAGAFHANVYPVFLTSLTTIIGFLSLNASDSPPFHVLGNFVAFGVLMAFVYSVTLLPALLSILPLRAPAARSERTPFFDRFGAFVVKRPTMLLCLMVVLVAALIAGVPRNVLTDNWPEYFDDRYEFRQDTDFILENLNGLYKLEYSLNAGSEGAITEPAYLQAVDAFAEWYREQPDVTHVQAFSDIMKRLNKNMHGDDIALYQLPDNPELAAQYLLLYELSLPFGADLNDRIDVGKSATRLTVTVGGVSSQALLELDARAQAWLQANTPDLATEATGFSIVFSDLFQRNIYSMLRGTIIAMGLISLILIVVFRSVKLGLVSLIPNFIPAIMTFGLWGYLVGQVGLAGSIMTAIAFGIVVDDTIHFLTKYRKARREGQSSSDAVRETFRTVGRALWTTTAVLSAGFLIFATSGFEVSWTLGVMVTMTIVLALLADFLLLPAILIALDRKKSGTPTTGRAPETSA